VTPTLTIVALTSLLRSAEIIEGQLAKHLFAHAENERNALDGRGSLKKAAWLPAGGYWSC
jgi:hypothetical protein